MVQNKVDRPRGRPRNYEPGVALSRATDAFWSSGFSGTSLDQVCEATGMNRPSLYLAFGDKRALYLAALRNYIDQSGKAMTAALAYDRPIDVALTQLYEFMLKVFLPTDATARGCFMITTAVPEAMIDPEIRSLLNGAVNEFDRLIHARLLHAKRTGDLADESDLEMTAKIVTAVVHTLAIRARAGEPREHLMLIIAAAVKMIGGSPSAPATAKSRIAP